MLSKIYIRIHVMYPLFLSDFKLEFSVHVFEEYSNIKFHENPSSGSRVVPRGQTDRRDEAKSLYTQFGERAKKKRRILEI